MDKQVETPLTFPPYRRSSHLQSETYRTLVRIMSHCYGSHSQVSLDTPRLAPRSPIPDNGGGNLGHATEIGVNECKQLVEPSLEHGSLRASHTVSEDNSGGNLGQATEIGGNTCGKLVDPGLEHISFLANSEDNGGGNSGQETEIGMNDCGNLVNPSSENGSLPASHSVSEDNCGGNPGQATEIGVNGCGNLVAPGLEHSSFPANHSVSEDNGGDNSGQETEIVVNEQLVDPSLQHSSFLASHSASEDNCGGNSGLATEIAANECEQLVDPGLVHGSLPASHSQVSLDTPQPAPLSPIQDNGGGNSEQATEIGANECGQLVDPGLEPCSLPASTENCEVTGVHNTGVIAKEMDIDEIDKLMGIDAVDDFLNMDMFVDNDNEVTGSQDYGIQEFLMDDLMMEIVTGNVERVQDNDKDDTFASPKNHPNGNDGAVLLINQEANLFHQESSMQTSEDVGQLKIYINYKVGEDCNSSADADLTTRNCNSSADADRTTKKIEASENIGDKISSLNTNGTELLEVEKLVVVANGTGRTDDPNSEDGEAEEGEISGDLGISELSASSPETVVSEEKTTDDMEVSEDVNSKKELAFNQQTVDRVKTAEIELSGRRNLVYYGEIVEDEAVGDQGVELKAKNVGVCNKKKRGILSQEMKIKKKRRERKRRAEKSQQLGVKRLKLQTVLKPKPVTICRHYLKGRCQEGDKCKFSHDAVPLTKSEPCRYFARKLCMKGDECPFDHQLSKYPCTNFSDTGFCGRSHGCMFSHKIPLKEGTISTSNVSKDGLKPSSLSGNSNMKSIGSTLHPKVNASSNPMGDLHLKMAETLLKQPASVLPKGFSFLSMQNPSTVGMKHGSSSPIPMVNRSGEVLNNNNAGVVQNINEIPKAAPKGINLLSFGKSPTSLKDSELKKPSSSPLKLENYVKSSLFKFNIFKQGSSTKFINDGSELGNRTSQSASAATQKSNEISTVSQPGRKFPSIGNDLRDESSRNQQYSNAEENKNAFGNFLRRLSASPQPSREGEPKTMQNSAQNVMSTLAFATRFGSQRKIINQAAASTSVDKEKVDSSGISSPIDHSDRASKILKFLSSTPGDVTKQ